MIGAAGRCVAYLSDEWRHVDGLPTGDESDANAALIVEAVNQYDNVKALVEAARELLNASGTSCSHGTKTSISACAGLKLRAALKPFEENK